MNTMLNFLANAKAEDIINFDFGIGEVDEALDRTSSEGSYVSTRITCIDANEEDAQYEVEVTMTKNFATLQELVELPDTKGFINRDRLWDWFIIVVKNTDFIGYGIPKK